MPGPLGTLHGLPSFPTTPVDAGLPEGPEAALILDHDGSAEEQLPDLRSRHTPCAVRRLRHTACAYYSANAKLIFGRSHRASFEQACHAALVLETHATRSVRDVGATRVSHTRDITRIVAEVLREPRRD